MEQFKRDEDGCCLAAFRQLSWVFASFRLLLRNFRDEFARVFGFAIVFG